MDGLRYLSVSSYILKGQITSEAIFLVLNSSKKQMKCLQNFALATRAVFFSFVFWKNQKQEQNLLIVTDL